MGGVATDGNGRVGLMTKCRLVALLAAAVTLVGCRVDQRRVPIDEHYRQGLIAAVDGRYEDARAQFTRALTADPRRAEILDARASAAVAVGDFTNALTDLEKAVRLEPDNPVFLTNRSQVYRNFGRPANALADLNRAIEIDPNFVAARFNRGALHFDQGRYTDALADFTRGIEADSTAAPAYFNRAVTLEAIGDVAGARLDLQRFLALSPKDEWSALARQLLEEWEYGRRPDLPPAERP